MSWKPIDFVGCKNEILWVFFLLMFMRLHRQHGSHNNAVVMGVPNAGQAK